MSKELVDEDVLYLQGLAQSAGAGAQAAPAVPSTTAVTDVETTSLTRSRAGGLITLDLPTGIQTILTAVAALNFNLLVLTTEDKTIALTGAVDGDPVILGVPNAAMAADVMYMAWVSAADTVSVRATRTGAGAAVDPGGGDFTVTIVK